MNKIFIVAGDTSGDLHASKLMASLKKINPDITFVGIGGIKMHEQGLDSIISIEKISVVGFWEVAKKYFFFKELLEKCKKILAEENISLFIPVDYPGFNIPLANFAKKINKKVVYYIAPQLWAWGKDRALKLKKSVDKLLVVFPFEKEFFESYGIDTIFVGHPLLDEQTFSTDVKIFNSREDIIAFLPGSRKQELKQHLPLFNKAAKLLKKELIGYEFSIAKAPSLTKQDYSEFLDADVDWEICENAYELMSKAKVGVIKTGTSTLEAALCGMPFTMIYKTSALSYFLGKHLIKMPFISLVNILKYENVITELIQQDAQPQTICNEVMELLHNEKLYENIQNKFSEIKNELGANGASDNAANAIYEFLNHEN